MQATRPQLSTLLNNQALPGDTDLLLSQSITTNTIVHSVNFLNCDQMCRMFLSDIFYGHKDETKLNSSNNN